MAVSGSSGTPHVDDPTTARQFLLNHILGEINAAVAKGETLYKVPWWRRAAWNETVEKFPMGYKGIDFELLQQEISDQTGYGCFDGHSGLEVIFQTPDEQKTAATKRVASWVVAGIKNIELRDWKKPYDGITASDRKMLRRWYPKAHSPTGDLLVSPADVEAIVKGEGPTWYISDTTTFAVRES